MSTLESLRALLRPAAQPLRCAASTRDLRARNKATSPLTVMLGAGGTVDGGWNSTDIDTIDISRRRAWRRLFAPSSIDALLAEHVWEHLDREAGLEAARLNFEFLQNGGYFRVVIPDGPHPDPAYRELVRPGGAGPGADNHRILHDYRSLARILADRGSRAELLEHFDERGHLIQAPWDPTYGLVRRSPRYDKRSVGGTLAYTSVVLGAIKAKV